MAQEQTENWEQEIIDLKNFFFNSIELPTEPIKLSQAETIIDIRKFINSHLSIVKAQNGNRVYLPYLNRLKKLKECLTIYFAIKIN
uniref:DUF6965 domain-containing protein n=1 Tax=viral metagenome TaxID=1070528 RepID=A0A6M3LV05_9ZZZZ